MDRFEREVRTCQSILLAVRPVLQRLDIFLEKPHPIFRVAIVHRHIIMVWMTLACNCLVCTAYKLGREHAAAEKEAAVADMRRILYKIKFALEQTMDVLPPDPMNDERALLAEIIEALDKAR